MTDAPVNDPRTRLPSLTGMRILAALLVFFCHATFQAFYGDRGPAPSLEGPATAAGWLGVAFFFVLSGFVLTWSSRPGDAARDFWRRRFVKIYPNHLVTWTAVLLLAFLPGQAAADRATWGKTLPSLLLVHAWVPDAEVMNALHIPSWSLSCELLFYLCFPLVIRAVRAIGPDRLWGCAAGLVALVVLVPALAQWLLPDTPKMPWFPMSVWDYWAVYSLPPVRLLEFTLGVVMARIVLSGRWVGLGLGPAFCLLAAGVVLQVKLVPSPWAMVAPTVVPLALVIAAAADRDSRGRPSLLAAPVMIWLGEISFALYLVHLPVLTYGRLVLGGGWSAPAALGVEAGLLGVALALAAALHTWVERPAMRRWSRRRPGRAAPAPRPVTEPS
ncbi:acyltransferase family protein [Actinomadura nitritigenes]|uniref:acyltransferase family protein n=1 Tax=Actinomadura nitritigenes TaxID=134602 RepID=UPI003D90B73C